MRPRHSITGPLVLILLGVIFLLHTFAADFHFWGFFGTYWPYLIILWGCVQLAEAAFYALSGRAPVPYSSLGPGTWFLVVLIAAFGFGTHYTMNFDPWWNHVDWNHGENIFGSDHDFSIQAIQRVAPAHPKIVIERFRGDAKINAGTDGTVTVGGHKIIKAMDDQSASRVDAATPVSVEASGDTIIIRCSQENGRREHEVTTNLEITVPAGSTIDATGERGDFDITGVNGDVDITSGNAGVRISDVKGAVKIDTGKSDEIRLANIGGAVTVRGHGDELTLADVAGEVDIQGEYSDMISLARLAKHVHVTSMRAQFEAASIPGQLKMERGSLDADGLAGPMQINTHDMDIGLSNYTGPMELAVDKGDVELRPGRVPLGSMDIRNGAGGVDLALPPNAAFTLTADTDGGDIKNDLGLAATSAGDSMHLTGGEGKGAAIVIRTRRGDVNIHHVNGGEKTEGASDEKSS